MSSLIAVAEPDPTLRTEITRALTAAEFSVVESGDGMHALRQVFSSQPSAIVMELDLPLLGGLELVRVLRAASDVAILVMTDAPTPHLAGRVLDTGADHVIARPVHPVDLVARVRASLRRAQQSAVAHQPATQVIRTGSLTIDREAQVVTRRGVTVPMTRTEHLLLDAMARRVGQLCPHRYLLTAVWGGEYVDDTHYLRGYIASLRQKLEDDASSPRLLLTEWGTGYRLAALPPETLGPMDEIDDEDEAVDGDGDRTRFPAAVAS
jgi:two-component system KDP operon response regulator KdpE